MHPIQLYEKYHLSRADERLGLFQLLSKRYAIQSALYPGCFVHITPAFVYPVTYFVDAERRAERFFADPAALELVRQRKQYPQEPQIRFLRADYAEPLPLEEGSFDLLISQYAGFVGQACKRYLRTGGYLVANNSHGDAGVARLDPEYTFVGAISRRGERFSFTDSDLDTFFIPKKAIQVTREYLLDLGRGLGYRRSAFAYLFQRNG